MPLHTTKIQPKCAVCGKAAVELARTTVENKTVIILKCGHISTEDKLVSKENVVFKSVDGYEPFPFQVESAKFALNTHGRVLFGHEPGLGKTICAFYTIALMGEEEALPCVWVVKKGLIPQFFHQIIRWLGFEHIAQVIESGKDKPYPGFKHYIVSYDTLYRMDSSFDDIHPNTVVLDECQMIKNFGAKRTKGVFELVNGVKHILALSGTPILNNALEYFPVLHMLRPEKFYSLQSYKRYWINTRITGIYEKIGGLKDPDRFREYTKDFIIRFKKSEVLKDLPPISKGFAYMSMDEDLQQAHDKIVEEFGEAYNLSKNMDANNILAWMGKMRHVTGLAKIETTLDMVKEHLENTDRKLVVFVQHIDVGDIMFSKIAAWCRENGYPEPCRFTGGMNSEQIDKTTNYFRDKGRLMIASTLAAGEGLNLQFCSDCILHERQWNPPKEDQAFDRFHRIGQVNPVTARIAIALGSIDEWITELVEKKRANLAEALDNQDYVWSDTSMAKELAEKAFQYSTILRERKLKEKVNA